MLRGIAGVKTSGSKKNWAAHRITGLGYPEGTRPKMKMNLTTSGSKKQ